MSTPVFAAHLYYRTGVLVRAAPTEPLLLQKQSLGNLLRFLDGPAIEPTNNRAERALRGAVIARKVSHCSRNEAGADAFSAFTNVIRTLARYGGGQSVVDGLCGVFSAEPVHAWSI